VHRGTHETINKNRSRFLINFVFDRIGIHWDFDDYVEIVWQIAASWYQIQTHFYLKIKKQNRNYKTRDYSGTGFRCAYIVKGDVI
jgi:hypothetical protein